MALNMSGTNGNIPLDTSMDFDKVEHTSVLQIPLAYTILGHVFSLVFQIVADKQLLMVLDGKPSQDCLICCLLVLLPVILFVIYLYYLQSLIFHL